MRLPLLLACVLSSAAGFRYLVVFPLPSGSHNILGKGVVRALVEAGHEVTQITAFPDKIPQENVKQIDSSFLFEQFKVLPSIFETKHQMSYKTVKEFGFNFTVSLASNSVIQSFMMDQSQQFDAVITESFFSELYVGFSQVFQCPWINFAPAGMIFTLEHLVDEIQSPATSPTLITGFTVPMTFKERLINTFIIYYGLFETIFFDHPKEAVKYNEYFGPAARARGVELASYERALHNMSLLLLNTHPALAPAARLPPNVVEVAGFHIDTSPAPLPKDLQRILDSSEGVVYFSMGSNLKSADLPVRVREQLLAMFSRLPLTVLWKFEQEMAAAPANVHVRPWMPQQSILAHKKVMMFITHGGLLSTTEAVHAGVPLISIPVYGDQFVNAKRAESRGYSVTVALQDEAFVQRLEEAISTMLHDPSYRSRAQSLSKLFLDRPVPPARLLSYWAGHVVRTAGAPLLRSPAHSVPLYQRWLLDIAAVICVAMATALFLVVAACRFVRRLLRTEKVTKDKKRK